MTAIDTDSALKQASDALDKGDAQAAVTLYEQVLEQEADNHEACLMLGSLYGELGRLPEAVGLLQHAARIKPDDAAAGLVLAHIYRATGDTERAVSTLEQLSDTAEDAEVLYTLGTLEEEAGNRGHARSLFDRAIELSPDEAGCWLAAGSFRMNDGEYAAAEKAYREVLRLEPGNSLAAGFLSVALTQLDRIAEAEQLLRGALATDSGNPDLHYFLASLLRHQGMGAEALESCEQALARAPGNPKYTIKKAEILEGMGDLDQAFDLLRPLIESGDIPVDAALTFARLSHPLGMVDDGKLVLQRALQQSLAPVQRRNIDDALAWLDTV
jgi:tetratricopeptide (TPR) repeat protein